MKCSIANVVCDVGQSMNIFEMRLKPRRTTDKANCSFICGKKRIIGKLKKKSHFRDALRERRGAIEAINGG